MGTPLFRRFRITLPPELTTLPGSGQRRRLLALVLAVVLVLLLRPYGPLIFLPGWIVGALLLWTIIELLRLAWWPQRWR